jgi:hypothetical protein
MTAEAQNFASAKSYARIVIVQLPFGQNLDRQVCRSVEGREIKGLDADE